MGAWTRRGPSGPAAGQRFSLKLFCARRLGRRRAYVLLRLVLSCAAPTLRAQAAPILHEPILPDPRDDLALGVALDGNLHAALETPSGLVAAPDPRRPLGQSEARLGRVTSLQGHPFDSAGASAYVPDTDTRRPDALLYDDPFTPSTAPFKRLVAFDAVDASYRLVVQDPTSSPLRTDETVRADGTEEQFFADLVVSPSIGHRVRIPSVGPGARVVHARYGSGPRDIEFTLWRDGAQNWFIEAAEAGRLVMELTVPRAAFGGEFGDPHRSDLHTPTPPPNVLRDATRVAATIGVDRTSPRDIVKSLVAYFRSFTDSSERPSGKGNAYLDLALSRKGVCRHRAYAFTVTALALGIPTRMIMNEAHAWVEVYDGSLWRRVDLGGAGRALVNSEAADVTYAPPPDPFAWPPDAERGDDLARRARSARTGGSSAPSPGTGGNLPLALSLPPIATASAPLPPENGTTSVVTLDLVEADIRRGAPLHVRGQVQAHGDACPHALVLVGLRNATTDRSVSLGALATDEAGAFSGAVVVPVGTPAGDYEVVGHTPGGSGCPPGATR